MFFAAEAKFLKIGLRFRYSAHCANSFRTCIGQGVSSKILSRFLDVSQRRKSGITHLKALGMFLGYMISALGQFTW